MKNSLTTLLLLSCIASATTATYNIGTSDNFYVESSNGSIASGASAYLGTFSSAPTSSVSLTDAISNFRRFDYTSQFTSDSEGWMGSQANFTDDFDNSPQNTANYDFENEQIYIFVTDVSTFGAISSSTEFAIISATSSWGNFPTAGPGPFTFNLSADLGSLSSSDIIRGSLDSLTIVGGSFPGTYDSIQLVSAVPEPSSTALLGLGSVALLLRRRR